MPKIIRRSSQTACEATRANIEIMPVFGRAKGPCETVLSRPLQGDINHSTRWEWDEIC